MALKGTNAHFKGRRARVRARAKLRQRHGLIGLFAGLFLVVSGLPWTVVWGEQVQQFAAPRGLSLWGEDPGATSKLGDHTEHLLDGHAGPTGWAIGETPLPTSATAQGAVVTIDTTVASAAAAGVVGPYFVAFPDGPDGVYSVMGDHWNDPANPASAM